MKLKGLTIAAHEVDQMVRFYNEVFASNLQSYQAFGTTLYRGELAGFELTLCPNELLEIKAEKNRQQLSFWVEDLDAVLARITACGGTQMQEIVVTEAGRVCGVTDPDGNSIELMQRIEW